MLTVPGLQGRFSSLWLRLAGEGRDNWHYAKEGSGLLILAFFAMAGDKHSKTGLSVTLNVHGLVECFHVSLFNIVHPFVS